MTENYSMTFREDYGERLYDGFLCKDRPVIVRQHRTSSETERQMFLDTMSALSQKNHKYVANVVGFHLGKRVSMCVYESCCDLSKSMFAGLIATNRNLYDTISSMEKLPLRERLSIAVQCAEGLLHIHSLAAENPDYGTSLFGNFRSANIFLDSNFVPKVFNANLSTFSGLSVEQRNASTDLNIDNHGQEKYYLDPSDISTRLLNHKPDVYSFGVVLLELMIWKTVRYKSDGRAHFLTTDFLDTYRRNRDAIEVFGKVFDEQGGCFLHEAIDIAVECLVLDFHKRPKLSYVHSHLRIIAAAQNIRSRLLAVNNATIITSTIESTISLNELNEITRNFSNDVLIRGTSIFLGARKDGQKCAIKKFKLNCIDEDSLVQIQTLSKMPKHDNVVPLVGYFIDEKSCILAYEYAPKGSLYDILHGMKKGVNPLSWMQRVKIAVSAARGFFHEKAEPPIIHTNIKSSNIFLFDDDVAKIGNVIPSRKKLDRVSDTTMDDWTMCTAGTYRKMSGTYRFGVVLLELLTGRKVFDKTLPRGQQILVHWARPRLCDRRKVKRCVDPRLAGAYPPKAVAKLQLIFHHFVKKRKEKTTYQFRSEDRENLKL